jgi:hypothetical protein
MKNWKISSGKHKGMTFQALKYTHPDYCDYITGKHLDIVGACKALNYEVDTAPGLKTAARISKLTPEEVEKATNLRDIRRKVWGPFKSYYNRCVDLEDGYI